MRPKGWRWRMGAAVFGISVAAWGSEPDVGRERAYVIANSDFIDSAVYSPARKELTLFFRSGSAFTYHKVPGATFNGFLLSESPGRFYRERLRGQFASQRLTEDELMAVVNRHEERTAW